LTDFSKNLQISDSTKIRSAGAELFDAVGRKDRQIRQSEVNVVASNPLCPVSPFTRNSE